MAFDKQKEEMGGETHFKIIINGYLSLMRECIFPFKTKCLMNKLLSKHRNTNKLMTRHENGPRNTISAIK